MADIKITDVTYNNVPKIEVPLAEGGGNAEFFDTTDATLDSGDKMLSGLTAYANGTKYTGTIQSKTSTDLSASGATVTVPAGHYASQATKSISSGTVTAPTTISGTSATVSTGTNTLTLSKTVSVTPNVSTAGYISSGTAGNASVTLTANVTTKGTATLQPSTSAVTISEGTYITGTQTIPAEPNYLASNIVAGKSLWGLNGSAQIPTISQNATTKVLSIS